MSFLSAGRRSTSRSICSRARAESAAARLSKACSSSRSTRVQVDSRLHRRLWRRARRTRGPLQIRPFPDRDFHRLQRSSAHWPTRLKSWQRSSASVRDAVRKPSSLRGTDGNEQCSDAPSASCGIGYLVAVRNIRRNQRSASPKSPRIIAGNPRLWVISRMYVRRSLFGGLQCDAKLPFGRRPSPSRNQTKPASVAALYAHDRSRFGQIQRPGPDIRKPPVVSCAAGPIVASECSALGLAFSIAASRSEAIAPVRNRSSAQIRIASKSGHFRTI